MMDTHDSVVFSVRVPIDLAAKIARAARDEKKKRNGWIVEVLAERVAGAPVPAYAEGAPIVNVDLPAFKPQAVERPTDPKPPPLEEPQDVRAVIDVDKHAVVVCPHPKKDRKNLGYMVRCGLCGEKIE